jgi:hypothetical protein
MSDKIKMFSCVFPFDVKKYDKCLPTYNLAKHYAFEQDEPCIVYSPNGIIVATYMDAKWYPVH